MAVPRSVTWAIWPRKMKFSLPKSRAVMVYLSNVQPDREITPADIGLLDNVFVAAFR